MFCSTIIPTIGRDSLSRAVDSVLAQELPDADYEVIVVNDSGRKLPLAKWQQSDRVQILHTNKRERSVARNSGAAIAAGAYLHFLDDDDWLLPGALQHLWHLAQSSTAVLLYGNTQLVDRKGNPIIQLNHKLRGNVFAQTMAGEWIPLQSSLLKQLPFFTIGGFNPLINGPEDIDLIRRLTLIGDVAGTDSLISAVGMGTEGSTTDYFNHASVSRWAREQILNQSDVFSRLRSSANTPYWRGRVNRLFLTSVIWNLKHKRLFQGVSRLAFVLLIFLLFGTDLLSPRYWHAITRKYRSPTFHRGFQIAKQSSVS